MPEHLRALVVILGLAGVVFVFARMPLTAQAMAPADYRRRWALWFAVTLIAHFAYDFWVFMGVTAVTLAIAARREHNPLALFAFLLFAVPPFSAPIYGMGVFNQLLVLDYPRLLAFVVLLPAALAAMATKSVAENPRPRQLVDLLVIGLLFIQIALRASGDSMTNTLRYGVYALLDVWLPYYVASRTLRDVRAFRDVVASATCALMLVALIAIFEMLRHWLLYVPLESALQVSWGLGAYLGRGAFLRAQGPTGQPIVLGYLMVVALCFYVLLYRSVPKRIWWWLGFAVLIGGLVASLSRGPWLAAAVALIFYRLVMPGALGGITRAAAVVALIGGAIMMSPIGTEVADYLPFIGTIEAENVEYRQRLFEVSTLLILQNPWFGSTTFADALVDQGLVIGGMVDIVNTFVGVGLANGLVGLGCFAGAFVAALLMVFWRVRGAENLDMERRTLGSAVSAAIVGIMATIFTVSSISLIPVVYWTVLGIAIAYCGLPARPVIGKSATKVDGQHRMGQGIGLRSRARVA